MPIVKGKELPWEQASEKLKIKYLLKQYALEKGGADVGIANWATGQAGALHVHDNHDEVYIVLRGKGKVSFNGEEHIVEPGDMMHAKSGDVHATVEVLSAEGIDVFYALLPVKKEL
ncbi:MAG: cupin domain-containing protein [Clostridiales bacterium]